MVERSGLPAATAQRIVDLFREAADADRAFVGDGVVEIVPGVPSCHDEVAERGGRRRIGTMFRN
jgi:hypothetical protein